MSETDKLQTLLEDYMRTTSSYRTTPIRSPYSDQTDYASGQVSGEKRWLDVTDVYNVTYRTIHHDNGYNKVLYNPAINVMVMWPKEGAEAYEQVDFSPVVQFGLKAARGYPKDYRWMDMSIAGSGKVAVDEETAEAIVNEPYDAIRNIRPEYIRAFGKIPFDDADYSPNVATDIAEEVITESSDPVGSTLMDIIREELSKELNERETAKTLDLNDHEASAIKKALRQYQMKDHLPNVKDQIVDRMAEKIGEKQDEGLSLGITSEEANILRKAVERYYHNVSDPDIENVAKKLNVEDPDVE